MKVCITTTAALRELATGTQFPMYAASEELFSFASDDATVLLHRQDRFDAQRIYVWPGDLLTSGQYPGSLEYRERDVLGRMASFSDRATVDKSLHLPRGWHQYKSGSLISFFAVHSHDSSSSRWIAETLQTARKDVVFWELTNSANKQFFETYRRPGTLEHSYLDATWRNSFDEAEKAFRLEAIREPSTDISLNKTDFVSRGRTYEDWLTDLTPSQQAFLDAPTNTSIKLRGPAGTGKSLSLALKAYKQVLRTRRAGSGERILFATHSWALASSITQTLETLAGAQIGEIDVVPLLELAQEISPLYRGLDGVTQLLGEDNLSSKQLQVREIVELLNEFIERDWPALRSDDVSVSLASRLNSPHADEISSLAWDLSIEFGSVIGAAAIFPGAGSLTRYKQLSRAPWMIPLSTSADRELVFKIYERYMKALEDRGLITSDQVLSDLVSYLETHAWNRLRTKRGYDYIFVDEYHLFNSLERMALHYLTNNTAIYPRIFMALDPRQSPSEGVIDFNAGLAQTDAAGGVGDASRAEDMDLNTNHRATPEIASLIAHLHHEYPTWNLGEEWQMDSRSFSSSQPHGPVPTFSMSESREGEQVQIFSAVESLYARGKIAIAVIDGRQWPHYTRLAELLGKSDRYYVSTLTGRSDLDDLGYRKRGIVVAPAEYLAGLQFESVIVAGIPDGRHSESHNDVVRQFSLLYLAISRAERDVRIFTNHEYGFEPQSLLNAIEQGLLAKGAGSLT